MASRNPMLLKILEDFPNSNQSNSVKSESANDFLLNDLFNCNTSPYLNSFNRNNRSFLDTSANQLNYHTVSLNNSNQNHNSITMNSHLPNTSSSFFQTEQLFGNNNCLIGTNNTISNLNNKTKFNNNLNLQLTNKSQYPKNDIDDQDSIDLLSIKGKFGWTSCNDIPLPYILRKDDKLIPVRIVETKLINPYGTELLFDVFNCINIKSFYITDNESKLLNEINSLHCDYYYGSDKFTVNDVVVNLNDVLKINSFLEISKKVFIQGISKCDFLGFVQISGNSTVIPFIIKETENINKQKQESNSSITSPLSNLSIKKPIQDQQSQIQDDFINKQTQSDKSPQPLTDLKVDDLSGFFNDDDNDDLLSKIDNSNDNQFNDNNSLSGLEDDNLDHHLNTNFNDQFENIILELDNDLNNSNQQSNYYQINNNSTSFNNNLKKKFVPVFLVEDHLLIDDAEQIELNEWDVSYLKMCCIYAGFDNLKKQFSELSSDLTNSRNLQSKYNLNLVCLNDVKWDKTYNPITIKEIHINSVCKLRTQQPPLNNYQSTSSTSLHSTSSNLNNNLIPSNKKYSLHTQHYQPSQSSSYNFKKTNLTKDSNCDPFNLANKLMPNNYTSSSSSSSNHLNKYSPSSSDYSSTSDSTDRITGLQFAINNFTNFAPNNDNNSNLFQSNPSTSNFNQFNNTTTHVNNYDTRDRLNNSNLTTAIGQLNSNPNLNNQSNNTAYNQSTKSNHQFNYNKNYGGLSNLNSIQNTSSIFDDIMKFNMPSNGLNNQSLTNQLIDSNLQYNNNHQNNSLQLINNLNNNLHNYYHQQKSPVNNTQPIAINQLNQLIDDEPLKISFIQIENKNLRTINLKPLTNLQAVQLSEIEKQFFNGIGLCQLKNYLEKRLNIKLYDLTRTQQYALGQHYGFQPSQEDKLILVDDLIKLNLSQMKLILCCK